MTDSSTEDQPDTDDAVGITDERLPEDLRPTEDNPLAQPLDEEVSPEDLDVHGGKPAEEWDDEDLED